MSEARIDLPAGWSTCSIDELLEYIQPTEYIVNSTDYSEAFSTPVLTAGKTFVLGKTNEEHGVFTQVPVIIFDDFTTATKYVNFPFKVKSSAMKILICASPLVNLKYCFYFMQTIQHKAETHKRYWISEYSKLPISLPPLAEQKRIVEKIEELLSSLDKGIEYLKGAQEQLKVYRQAVLKQAFEGKLTNKDVKDGKLPEGWVVAPLGSYIKLKNGFAFKSDKYVEFGIPVIRISDIGDGIVDISGTVAVDDDDAYQDYVVKRDDILVAMSGATTGKFGRYLLDVKAFQNQRVGNFVIKKPDSIIKDYLFYIVSSLKEKILKDAYGGAQPNISSTKIEEMSVVVAPITEQSAVVSAIEHRLSIFDKLEESIAISLQQTEALRQSILKKAFAGMLVPQNPDDEPASVLLERIRAEREAGDAKPLRTRVAKTAILDVATPLTIARQRGKPRKNAGIETNVRKGKK